MTVLADFEIKALAEKGMIEPFVDHSVRVEDGKKIFSYGLSSYGYDIRLSDKECLLFGGIDHGEIDPKNFDNKILKPIELHEGENGAYFLMPPHSYVLGVAEERLKLPRDVLVIAVGKSSLARSGIIVNITPAEAEWEGYLTLEIANVTPHWQRLYAREGICQILFQQGRPCVTSYQDRSGKYQNQNKEVVTSSV